ncbi:MAG TPA: hypothetical protein VI932_03695 [Bacteroidota bacterium]|nr:hypothetical protein [Bacteroidota bacterium]
MKSSVHPVPLLFFLSVVALILAYQVYHYAGAVIFLASTFILAAAIGWSIGRRWLMYPWQIGLLGAIPAAAFVLWRLYTQVTPEETADNISLFVFHPLLVMIAGHFGGLVGRWQALKARSGGTR